LNVRNSDDIYFGEALKKPKPYRWLVVNMKVQMRKKLHRRAYTPALALLV
jgi:hypothetical protein